MVGGGLEVVRGGRGSPIRTALLHVNRELSVASPTVQSFLFKMCAKITRCVKKKRVFKRSVSEGA